MLALVVMSMMGDHVWSCEFDKNSLRMNVGGDRGDVLVAPDDHVDLDDGDDHDGRVDLDGGDDHDGRVDLDGGDVHDGRVVLDGGDVHDGHVDLDGGDVTMVAVNYLRISTLTAKTPTG